MHLFLRSLLVGAILWVLGQAAFATVPPQTYQWFRLIDTDSIYSASYAVDMENFGYFASTDCDESRNCLAFLMGVENKGSPTGKIIVRDELCGSETVTLPLTLVNGNITTDAPVHYTIANCVVDITGDPTSPEGYKIIFDHTH